MSRVKVARFGCTGMAHNPFRSMHQYVESTQVMVLFKLSAEQHTASAAYFKELTTNFKNF